MERGPLLGPNDLKGAWYLMVSATAPSLSLPNIICDLYGRLDGPDYFDPGSDSCLATTSVRVFKEPPMDVLVHYKKMIERMDKRFEMEPRGRLRQVPQDGLRGT